MAIERLIRDPAFAERMEQACSAHPVCPPLHRGRLRWIADEMRGKFKLSITTETVRKWTYGEARPRDQKLMALAQLLNVDPTWLRHGVDSELDPREKRARNAVADAAVNIVTGLIQMDGGVPAFPTGPDADSAIDLYAIIKGMKYNLHVTAGDIRNEDEVVFTFPSSLDGAFVLGLIREDGFTFRVTEVPADLIQSRGQNRGGSTTLVMTATEIEPHEITSFARRL